MEMIGVRLPEDQKKEVEELAEEDNYPNVSEYVRELIRQDIREREKLKKEVIEQLERRRQEVEEGEVEIDDMRSMEELAEDEGLKDR